MSESGSQSGGEHAALEVVDLHKSFGDVEVIRGVSLSAHKGDVISILGASGSGKSTFLRCINLLEIPTAGDVYVAGEKIRMKSSKSGAYLPEDIHQVERLRARLGMVFQGFNLWSHMTVIENVIEAPVHVLKIPKAQAIEEAEALLHKVGIYDRKDYYPAQLSGGQQQRVAVARALVPRPDIVFADEPTGALDSRTGMEMLSFMRQAVDNSGQTIVMVTHDPHAASYADNVLFLADGQIIDEMPQPTAERVLDRMKRFEA